MNRLIFSIILIVSSNILIKAQIDREFWFAVPKETNSHLPTTLTPTYNASFKIAAMNLDANVSIEMPANPYFTTINVTVPANTSVTVPIATDWVQFDSIYANPAPWNVVSSSGTTNHGFRITSDNDITVYYDYDNFWNRDLFSLKGKNALGTEFYTPFQNIWQNGIYALQPYATIDIVATENNTQVTVYPTQPIQGFAFPGPISFTLNRGQTFSLRALGFNGAAHPTGTRIVSNKKIAVTINDDSVQKTGGGCRDVIGDQLISTDIIGAKYLVMTGNDATSNAGAQIKDPIRGEQVFITTTQPNTRVIFQDTTSAVLLDTTIVNAGSSTYISPDRTIPKYSTIYVRSTDPVKPIYVFHITGHGCELGGAVLPPITDCTGSPEVTVVPSATGGTDVAPNWNTTKVTINMMVRYDTTKIFTDPTQAHYHFTLYNSTMPSGFAIPGTWFEPNRKTGWAVLSMAHRDFGPGGANLMVLGANKFVNTDGFFHLGMSNGTATYTNKYGYFSSFNFATAGARVAETEAQSLIACFGQTITLVASGGLSYLWHYGVPSGPSTYLSDPTSPNPNVIGLPVGLHHFYVEVRNQKCFGIDTLKVDIAILLQPIANFTIDKSAVCPIDSVYFTNQSQNSDTYLWTKSIDNGPFTSVSPSNNMSFTEVFNNLTTVPMTIRYKLYAENNNGCSDTISKTITVYPKIQADFTASQLFGCNPLLVNFSNESNAAADQFVLNFGDGTSSNVMPISHLFINSADSTVFFPVTLIASSTTYGCGDTITKPVWVYSSIKADFTIDDSTGCSPLKVNITNKSTGGVSLNMWNYGCGNGADNAINPTPKTYINTNGFNLFCNLRLVVTNGNNCYDTLIRPLTIYPKVNANFTANVTEGCNPLQIYFTNTSGPGSVPVEYDWKFGDGDSSVVYNRNTFAHLFTNLGSTLKTFPTRLIAYSQYKCADTVDRDITVYPYVSANFAIDNAAGCSPFPINITNASLPPLPNRSDSWSFGDGTSSTSSTVSFHQYRNSTSSSSVMYNCRLIIAYKNGSVDMCYDTIIRQVEVYPEVTADFNQDTLEGCNPLQINFTNASRIGTTIPPANKVSYDWVFGDQVMSVETNPAHIFNNSSNVNTVYKVSLTTTSIDYKCIDTIAKQVIVHPKPKADFSTDATQGNSPLTVSFTNKSTGTTSFKWDFGDESMSTDLNPSHEFINSGVNEIDYNVKLLASNTICGSDSTTKLITVLPKIISGIELQQSGAEVKSFPNPAKDIIYIKYSLTKPSDIIIDLLEPTGRLLNRITEYQKSAGENVTTINIESFSGNLFFVKVILNGKSSVFKIIKQ